MAVGKTKNCGTDSRPTGLQSWHARPSELYPVSDYGADYGAGTDMHFEPIRWRDLFDENGEIVPVSFLTSMKGRQVEQRFMVVTNRMAKRLLARSRKSEQPLLHYLILVMAHTGARPSEVYPYQQDKDVKIEPLIWQAILDYDFKGVRIVAYKGKVRKERIVPTSEALERGLRKFYSEAQPQPDDLLFPFTTIKRSWNTLCRSVGVSGITIRAFRAYFNSWLIERGFDEVSRMLILGHERITTNLRYSTLTPEFAQRFRQSMK